MPFFVPRGLIEPIYLTGQSDEDYNKKAKPFSNELDFAFFVVNFGYNKSDYEALTPTEKALIFKAWEDKKVLDSSLMYKAAFTAYYNCNRQKNKRALKLWTRQGHKADKAEIDEVKSIVKAADINDGKSWVDIIYKSNGLRR